MTKTLLKTVGCLAKRGAKGHAGFDVSDYLVDNYLEGFVGGLLGDLAQALDQRQAGINERGKLAAEQHLVLGLYPVEAEAALASVEP